MAELLKIGEIEGPDSKPPNDEAVIYTNDNDDWREITVEGRDAPEFAAFIVKAVNEHAPLTQALATFLGYLQAENGCKRNGAARRDKCGCDLELQELVAAFTALVGSETERGK